MGNQINEKMENKMENKIISFTSFCEWHNYDNSVSQEKLIDAYEVYKSLVTQMGAELAGEEICGHPVWDN